MTPANKTKQTGKHKAKRSFLAKPASVAVASVSVESRSEATPAGSGFLALADIDSYTETDLDALLNKATVALEMRAAEAVAAQAALEEEEEERGEGVLLISEAKKNPFRGQESLLVKVKLDAGLQAPVAPYFVETSASGPVRLNPATIEIATRTTESVVPRAKGVGSDNSHSKDREAIEKGLAKGAGKRLVDRIVVSRVQSEVSPELDYDAKTKKKMIKETAGPKWFDMPAPDLTDKLKREIQIIKARNVLDPKHHYKRADKNAPEYPKFFQMGTVIEGAGEFHKLGRIAKRDRRDGLVEEVLADYKTKGYLKRKFGEIQEAKQARSRKPTQKLKKGKSGSISGKKRR
ncbi:Fcf2 pre-rRNA processing-domain-containing protein [Chytriomyces sp. MP71]|nr:Fcf2 pre-rRNA processing-domain-containing protein [Chytriomyces sp. MP71]